MLGFELQTDTRKPFASELFAPVLAITFFVTTGICSAQERQDAAAVEEASSIKQEVTESEIADWVALLNADAYLDRQRATEALTKAGPVVIPTLIEAWSSSGLEQRIRIKDILKQVGSTIDSDTEPQCLEALREARGSSDPQLRAFAIELIGPEPDSELVQELKAAIAQVVDGEKNSVPISKELLNKLQESGAYRVVQRPPLRNTDRNSPWRRLDDAEAHTLSAKTHESWGKLTGWKPIPGS